MMLQQENDKVDNNDIIIINEQHQHRQHDAHVPQQDNANCNAVVVENLLDKEEHNNGKEYITREEQQEAIIVECLSLPVEETAAANHRPQRNGDGLVELIKKKQFDNKAQTLVYLYATHLTGYHRDLSYHCKLRISEAACTIIAYDYGYKSVIGKHSIKNWIEKIEDSVNYSSAKNVFQSKHKGKTSYMDRITLVYPTYLHNLWRQATNLLGDNATFEDLAHAMNL
jgi:hypothetical protein